MQFVDIIMEQLSYRHSSVGMRPGNEMSILGQLVNNYQDCVKPLGFRQAFNEVPAILGQLVNNCCVVQPLFCTPPYIAVQANFYSDVPDSYDQYEL